MFNDLDNVTVDHLSFHKYDYQLDGNTIVIPGSGAIDGDGDSYYQNTDSHTTTINCQLIFLRGGSISVGDCTGDITETTDRIYLNGPIQTYGNYKTSGERLSIAGGASGLDGPGNGKIYVTGPISGTGDVFVGVGEDNADYGAVELTERPEIRFLAHSMFRPLRIPKLFVTNLPAQSRRTRSLSLTVSPIFN